MVFLDSKGDPIPASFAANMRKYWNHSIEFASIVKLTTRFCVKSGKVKKMMSFFFEEKKRRMHFFLTLTFFSISVSRNAAEGEAKVRHRAHRRLQRPTPRQPVPSTGS